MSDPEKPATDEQETDDFNAAAEAEDAEATSDADKNPPPPPAEKDEDEPGDDTPPAKGDETDEGAAASEPTAEEKAKALADQESAAETEAREAQEYWNTVSRFHPDAEELYGDPKLLEWAKKQTPEVRAMLGSKATAVDAVYALNLFKKDTGGRQAPAKGEDKDTAPTEETATYLRLLREYGISGEKVSTVIDGETKMATMEELAKTFPDIFETQARIMLKAMDAQEKRFQKMLADSGYVKGDELKDLRAMADERKVLAKHSDANTIEADPKFTDWRKTLPKPLQDLYDSGKPDNKIAIIDLWKETQAKEAGASVRGRQATIHKNKASLHSETLRGTPPPSGKGSAGTRDDDDEFAAEANAADG